MEPTSRFALLSGAADFMDSKVVEGGMGNLGAKASYSFTLSAAGKLSSNSSFV